MSSGRDEPRAMHTTSGLTNTDSTALGRNARRECSGGRIATEYAPQLQWLPALRLWRVVQLRHDSLRQT
jgi:hypothetical protein